MSPWLGAWQWRLDVVLVLAGFGVAYVRGWRRLHRQGPGSPPWHLVCYLGGLTALALALLSPVAVLGALLFLSHMVQHQLLTMVAAPLLLLGNPLPPILWGLPAPIRRAAGRLLAPAAPARYVLRAATWLPVAGLSYVITLWAWHWPPAYQASLRSEWLHDAQHLSFFLTSLLLWWPVVLPAPRLRPHHGALTYGLGIVYLIIITAQNTLLGAILSLAERVLYPSYAAAPRVFGLTVLEDQALAGAIMWSSGHMYLIAILILVHRALGGHHETGPRDTRPELAREGSRPHG